MDGYDLKHEFLVKVHGFETGYSPAVVTVAVKLPSGAIEVITNTMHTAEKCDYYAMAYDEHFKLRTNNEIQIVGFMIV